MTVTATREVYRTAREHSTEKELVDVTLAVVMIKGWNRIAVAFQPEVRSDRSRARSEAK